MSFSLRALIARLFGRRPELAISPRLWSALLEGLRVRGRYRRESGAFLLGLPGPSRKVTSIVFYDEIDPHAFDTGIVVIEGGRIADLWRICRERGEVVVADVHTHGGDAGMSEADRLHPMIAETGHIAMILPNFAAEPVRPSEMGVYRYVGRFEWIDLKPSFLRPNFAIVGA